MNKQITTKGGKINLIIKALAFTHTEGVLLQ